MPKKVNNYHGPIRSHEIESMVIAELRNRSATYALVYRLIRETGIDFRHLTQLKAGDLHNKDHIMYETHSGKMRSMPLPEDLQQEINDFLKNTPEDAYAFTGKTNGNILKSRTMTVALESVSRSIGIDPPLSITSIRLTFVYNMVLKDGNCTNAMNYILASSAKDVYERLGIDPKDLKGEYLKGTDPKEKLFKYDILESLSDRVQNVLSDIRARTVSPENITNDYAIKALSCLESIDTAVTVFESATQNQGKQGR